MQSNAQRFARPSLISSLSMYFSVYKSILSFSLSEIYLSWIWKSVWMMIIKVEKEWQLIHLLMMIIIREQRLIVPHTMKVDCFSLLLHTITSFLPLFLIDTNDKLGSLPIREFYHGGKDSEEKKGDFNDINLTPMDSSQSLEARNERNSIQRDHYDDGVQEIVCTFHTYISDNAPVAMYNSRTAFSGSDEEMEEIVRKF
jgi:hypothetical protein